MLEKSSLDYRFIEKLTQLVEVNLENEQFGVKQLAKEMGLSRSQLHRKIQAYNGNSTSQFIREYRLKKAMGMLQNDVATASEIAYRVGFSSPTYFNTCFREYYGYPPGEVKYRNQLLGQKKTEGRSKETSHLGKNFRKRKLLLSISIALVILLGISYSFYMVSKDNKIVESNENIVSEKSIAVLPFKNWSGNPELEYISDGMTDAVISRLAKIESIENVIPFTSVLKYKESDKAIPEIANELRVQNILQGNFQLSGGLVKITLQLIDGPSNTHFWTHDYSGKWKTDEMFSIQAEVAENVARNMNVKINDDELEEIVKIPTKNKEAYNFLLQGNFQARKRTKEGMENAVPFYEKAIALDSTFVSAYIGLASSYLWGGANWGVFGQRQAWDKAKSLLQMANQLDSTNTSVKRALLDGMYIYEWNFDLMEKQYMNSSVVFAYLLHTGRYEESLAVINQRLYEYPASGFMQAWKAQALFFLNRKEEAINHLRSNDKLFNDHIDYLREASKCYYYLGEYESSKTLLKKIMTNFSDRPPTILWLNAIYNQKDSNNKYLSELQKKYETEASGSPAWFIALYHCHTQDYEKAFVWLQKSYVRNEAEIIWLREEPLLIPLRNDQRYIELYAKVGFPIGPHSTPE